MKTTHTELTETTGAAILAALARVTENDNEISEETGKAILAALEKVEALFAGG